MSTFSERKMRRIIDSFRDLSPTEFAEVQKRMQTYEPDTTNGKCGFLGLPAEIRNIIYHYVAADAHASIVAPKERVFSSLIDCKNTLEVRDEDGRKIRPGLFGTCREMFREFHSIFYSSAYVTATAFVDHKIWKPVTNPALLDAFVNGKHGARSPRYGSPEDEVKDEIESCKGDDRLVYGTRKIKRADGTCTFVRFALWLYPPFTDGWDLEEQEWTMSSSCLTLSNSTEVPLMRNRCALCLVSMGPERAASEQIQY